MYISSNLYILIKLLNVISGEWMFRKAVMLCLLCLLMVVSHSLSTFKAFTSLTTTVKVINPKTGDCNFIYYSNATSPGTRFNATIIIYNVERLYGFQICIMVDDSLLNITNAWIPKRDTSYVFYGLPTMPLAPIFLDEDGDGIHEAIIVGETILGAASFTGSGVLALVEFEIINIPERGERFSEINIDNPDTILLDSDLNDITATKTGGLYKIFGAPVIIPPALLYLDPARIVDPTLTPCSNFNIDINIQNATNIYALKLKVSYDPLIISATSLSFGSFFPPESYSVVIIDNSVGKIEISAQLTPPEPSRSGGGKLVTIYFHVKSVGVTVIDLSDVELLDPEGGTLPAVDRDSFFNNIFMSKIYVDPPELISYELLPPKVFSVNITIDDVDNLYGYEFTLRYNTKMLTCIGVFIYPVSEQSAFTTSLQIDDMQGWLWVNVAYYEPAIPITTYTPEPIVRITFIVEKPGSSLLDLDNTLLLNSTGYFLSHEAFDGYVQTLIRDVAVTNITVEPEWVYKGWPVNIMVTVKNMGNVSETFDVKVYYDSIIMFTRTVDNLQPGQELTLYFVWNTTEVAEGVYTICAEVTRVPYEFNTKNNVYIDGALEVRTLIRDVAITELSMYPMAVYPGWVVNISITIKNEGNLTESFTVILYYNNSVLGFVNVKDLYPNEKRTIFFYWNTTGLPECSKYVLSAEVKPLPYEIDLKDNYLANGYVKIKILGDINGDGKVDIRDVSVVASAFGSFPNHSRWNSDADLNKDGLVNIRDIAMVCANFGRTCGL